MTDQFDAMLAAIDTLPDCEIDRIIRDVRKKARQRANPCQIKITLVRLEEQQK